MKLQVRNQNLNWMLVNGIPREHTGVSDADFYDEKNMTKRKYSKLIHEGQYIAGVEIELIDTDEGWPPYLS